MINNSMFIIALICLLFTGAAMVAFIQLGRMFFDQADYELKITVSAKKAKSAFLATMSHEIRTRMNIIFRMTELLLQRDLPDEARKEVLDIKQAGNNFFSIMSDVLDLSKIETGKTEPYPVDYNIPSLIHDAAQPTYSLMPYGKVLIVDDLDTNLYIAEGLLAPYKLTVETADSGFAAIDKINQGQTYDIVFMDQKMPQMDGIETTQKLRLLGYNGIIVALTANAPAGNDEMFNRHGFDGFISKPIDIRQLNSALNTFVRDAHPEEAEKWKSEVQQQTRIENEVNPKLLRMFRRDAEEAAVTLRETIQNGDIKLFTTTAHAMKSALANVREHDASELAFSLEKAGLSGDMGFITANTETFIETLEALIIRFTPQESTSEDQRSDAEDTAYLIEQLKLVETACTHYDDTAAYAALDRLKEKKWGTETAITLEKIHDTLFLNSDFEVAAEQSRTFAKWL